MIGDNSEGLYPPIACNGLERETMNPTFNQLPRHVKEQITAALVRKYEATGHLDQLQDMIRQEVA